MHLLVTQLTAGYLTVSIFLSSQVLFWFTLCVILLRRQAISTLDLKETCHFVFMSVGAFRLWGPAVQQVAMASPGRQGGGGGGGGGGALSTRGGSGARRMKWALELSLGNTRWTENMDTTPKNTCQHCYTHTHKSTYLMFLWGYLVSIDKKRRLATL